MKGDGDVEAQLLLSIRCFVVAADYCRCHVSVVSLFADSLGNGASVATRHSF
jgi:hypothetical protein